MYSGLIERKLGGSPQVAKDIDLVQKETHRCKRIVAGLLDFARQNRVHFASCHLNELSAEIVEKSFNTAQLESKNVQLNLDAGTRID